MNKQLWAPWRMSYIKEHINEGCFICKAASQIPDNNQQNLVLASRKAEFVIMNRYPYSHGHIMVVPHRHVNKLSDLTSNEQQSFFSLVADTEAAVRNALNPQGVNLGMNIGKAAGAGLEAHIHLHIIPRWDGDTNFMPLISDCRIMPEHINETYNNLLPFFENIRLNNDE